MWRRTRKQRQVDLGPSAAAHSEGLPSRKERHARKRFPAAAMLGSGIAVFGLIFFGLIGLELYQAKETTAPAAVVQVKPVQEKPITSGHPPKKANEPQPVQSSSGTAAKKPAVTQSTAKAAAKPAAKPASPQPSAKPTASPKAKRHVVRKGDTLFKLSRYYYGNHSGVSRIARYNGLRADQELIADTVIMIPVRP